MNENQLFIEGGKNRMIRCFGGEYEANEEREYLVEVEIPYATASQGLWKQQDGAILAIVQMGTDHLTACCGKIKKDMKKVESRSMEIKNEFLPLMQSKYNELKREITNRANKL